MTQFRVEFVVPTTYYAYIDAESESAVRQAFIDHDEFDEVGMVDQYDNPILDPDAYITIIENTEEDG